DCAAIDIADHPARQCRLVDANLQLVFLGYPDGGVGGEMPTSLLHLWDGTAKSAVTIADKPATYDRDGLIDTVGAIIIATQPRTIRTLEIAGVHDADHSDHLMVGQLTLLAALGVGSDAELLAYRGYNINYEPPTAPDELVARASLPVRAYLACMQSCDG